MIKSFARRFGILAALLGLIVGVGGVAATTAPAAAAASPAAAVAFTVVPASNFHALVSDNDISQNTVHSTAYRVGNGASTRFYGTLQAKTFGGQEYCYQMQYQTPAGNWTTSGFWRSESVSENPLSHCSSEIAPYITWSIHDGLNVRGIRFTNGANTGTHCGPLSATECRALTAP